MGDNEKLWGCLTKLKDLERDGIIDPETAQELMKSKKERILEKLFLLIKALLKCMVSI